MTDYNMKSSYAKVAKSYLHSRNPFKTLVKPINKNITPRIQARETSNSKLEGLIHSDTPDGFINVKRRWLKNKTFSDGVKKCQIYSYLSKRIVTSDNIHNFKSKRKGTISAKINIPLTSCSAVLEKTF